MADRIVRVMVVGVGCGIANIIWHFATGMAWDAALKWTLLEYWGAFFYAVIEAIDMRMARKEE